MASNPIYIPNELLISILKRLPPKTLIKFLTVSKSWYSLITSPNFISSHLHHHKYLSSFNNFSLPNPPTNFNSISTSVNGLICLFDSESRNLALWNPSINKSIQIEAPPILHVSSFHTFAVLGFGYDPSNDDYKIVLIDYDHMFIWGDNFYPYSPPYAQVYTVYRGKDLGWKRVLFPDFPLYDISRFSESCFVGNLIHWIVFRGNHNPMNEYGASILTFDPSNDCFGQIKLPESLIDPSLCLAITNDSLVVIHLEGGEDEEMGLSISAIVWKMEEYGVEDSWMMLYRIKLPCPYDMNPNIWDKEDGKVYISTSVGPLIVFNAQNGSSSVFDGEVAMMCGQAFEYTESLVLLDRFRKASWLQREQLQW